MNRKELKKALDQEKIHPVYYSLNGLEKGPLNAVHVLDKQGEGWQTYYFERGEKYHSQYFETEDKACRYFFKWICEDPTTRLDFIKKHPIQWNTQQEGNGGVK